MFFQIRLVFIILAVDAVSKSNDELRLKRAVDNHAPQGSVYRLNWTGKPLNTFAVTTVLNQVNIVLVESTH